MSNDAHTPDDNLTDEERRTIKGAIRLAFRQSERMAVALKRSRVELPPKEKKDGNLGKRNQIFYRCEQCNDLFKINEVRVDHKEPVVPLDKREGDLSMSTIIERIYCDVSNLQVLCHYSSKEKQGKVSCHSGKTRQENYIRKLISQTSITLEQAETAYARYLQEKTEKETKKKQRQLRLANKTNEQEQ